MLVQRSLPKIQLIIFGVLIVAALGVIGYLVVSKILAPRGIDLSNLGSQSQAQLFEGKVKLPDTRGFDEKFFDNELVRDLKNSANLPVQADLKGKSNPFEPLIKVEVNTKKPATLNKRTTL